MLKKKAELLVTDESLDNELQDNKNILANLSSHEVQNQVNLLIFFILISIVVKYLKSFTIISIITNTQYKRNTFQRLFYNCANKFIIISNLLLLKNINISYLFIIYLIHICIFHFFFQ